MTDDRKVVTVEGADVRLIAYALTIAAVITDPVVCTIAKGIFMSTDREDAAKLLHASVIKLGSVPVPSIEPDPGDKFSADILDDSLARIRHLALEFSVAYDPSALPEAFPERVK